MNCVRDMVISSEFFYISSYTRLISCLNGTHTIHSGSLKLHTRILHSRTSTVAGCTEVSVQ